MTCIGITLVEVSSQYQETCTQSQQFQKITISCQSAFYRLEKERLMWNPFKIANQKSLRVHKMYIGQW